MIEFLVTGTGRCGTVFMARLLTSLGIMCGHEAIFGPNPKEESFGRLNNQNNNTSEVSRRENSEWFDSTIIRAESSYMAAPFLDHAELKSVKIIHVVRHPLLVISSFVKDIGFFEGKDNNIWEDFVFGQLPGLNEINTEIERACYYYTQWNRMIETKSAGHPYLFHKIEDGCTPQLLEFLGVEKTESIFLNTRINSWRKRKIDLSFSDIPDGPHRREFVAMAAKYGYQQPKMFV